MKDIKLNYDRSAQYEKPDGTLVPIQYGDIHFKDGDIQITDSIVQAITIRLRWFLNEFKYQPSFGVPYYEDVFVKNPNINQIRQDLIEAINKVAEVDEVLSLDFEPIDNERKLRVKFVAKVKDRTEEGEVIVLG